MPPIAFAEILLLLTTSVPRRTKNRASRERNLKERKELYGETGSIVQSEKKGGGELGLGRSRHTVTNIGWNHSEREDFFRRLEALI